MKRQVEDCLMHWGISCDQDTSASIAYNRDQALLEENGLTQLTRIGMNGEDVSVNSFVDDMGRMYDGPVTYAISSKNSADMQRLQDINQDSLKKSQLLSELSQTPPLSMTDKVIDISPDAGNTGQLYINDLFNR